MRSDACEPVPIPAGTRLLALAGIVAIMMLGLLLRWQHLLNSDFMFDGDEASTALMGLHIAKGQHFPLIWYGQHYMGTIDAFISALGFYWFGISPVVHKLTLLLYAAAAMALLAWTSWRLWGWMPSWLAVALFAVAPAAIRWQTDATTAYSILFPFAIGLMACSVQMLCALVRNGADSSMGMLYGWAILAGIAFWMESLVVSLIVSLPLIVWLRGDQISKKALTIAVGCFLLGITPLLVHNIEYPFATLRVFLGFFLDIASRSQVEGGSVIQVIARGLWMRIDPTVWGMSLLAALRGPGYGPAGILAPVGYGAIVILLSLVGSALVAWIREARRKGWREWLKSGEGALLSWLLLSIGLVIFLGSTRARYLVLLVPLLSLLIIGNWSSALFNQSTQRVLVVCLLLYLMAVSVTLNIINPVRVANPYPALAEFLEAKGLRYGYAEYEIAYPLMFFAQERIIVSPLAGPTMLDRYPRYTIAVEQTTSPFYIYKATEPLLQVLTTYLQEHGIQFETSVVDHHVVIWWLSRAVRPDEFLQATYLALYRREHYSHPRAVIY